LIIYYKIIYNFDLLFTIEMEKAGSPKFQNFEPGYKRINKFKNKNNI